LLIYERTNWQSYGRNFDRKKRLKWR